MLSTSKRTAVLLSTAGLVAGSVALAPSAAAAGTECGPGDVKTGFDHHDVTTSKEAVSSVTLSNASGFDVPVSLTAQTPATATASVSGSVPLGQILEPLQAQVNADASLSESWSLQDPLQLSGPVTLGQSKIATYGFDIVSFSGSQQICQLDGQFGPPNRFSGTAPTGTYIEEYTVPYVPQTVQPTVP